MRDNDLNRNAGCRRGAPTGLRLSIALGVGRLGMNDTDRTSGPETMR